MQGAPEVYVDLISDQYYAAAPSLKTLPANVQDIIMTFAGCAARCRKTVIGPYIRPNVHKYSNAEILVNGYPFPPVLQWQGKYYISLSGVSNHPKRECALSAPHICGNTMDEVCRQFALIPELSKSVIKVEGAGTYKYFMSAAAYGSGLVNMRYFEKGYTLSNIDALAKLKPQMRTSIVRRRKVRVEPFDIPKYLKKFRRGNRKYARQWRKRKTIKTVGRPKTKKIRGRAE